MKKLSTIIIAAALLLGMAQCKKQETPASEGNVVRITLNVGGNNNGSRVIVDPTANQQVQFANGDQIVVASNGKVVGTLDHDGTTFSGDITDPTEGQPLYFYFLGNKQGEVANGTTELTVDISDQSAELPILSFEPSNEDYTSATTEFTATLRNKCALVKFTYADSTTETVTVGGMKTVASVNFANPAITAMETEATGSITLHPDAQGNTVKWAILLPQPAVEVAPVTIGNDNNFTASVPAVTVDQYYVGDDNNGVMIESATPADEHGYVDLGLPSGLLWADCNVGATSPEEFGDYFAWGETQPKDTYNWSTYQHCNGSAKTLTKYCNNSSYGYNGFTDNPTTLLSEDDAATANWGNGWRMPTKEEWQELYDNTTVTWTQQGGVNGRLFTASNGNSLFLPAAGYRYNSNLGYSGSSGYYWSSSLKSDDPREAWYADFYSGGYGMGGEYRYCGQSVRAVRSSRQN